MVLLGISDDDSNSDIDWLINKIINLRIFSDSNEKINLSLLDKQFEILVVSQFTLFASTKKGNRPSFTKSAEPSYAKKLYNSFINDIGLLYDNEKVQSGVFGADMKIELLNDGPVTLYIDTKDKE